MNADVLEAIAAFIRAIDAASADTGISLRGTATVEDAENCYGKLRFAGDVETELVLS